MIIVMENEPVGSVYNCGTSDCSYITGLANNNSFAENYYVTSCGSTADYLTLTGGSGFGYNCLSCPPLSCGNLWPILSPNIVDRVEASRRTWKAYMEDYPGSGGTGTNYSTGGCFLAGSGRYEAIHNPFLYYADIENSTGRCSKIIRANTITTTSGPEIDDVLLNDLQSPSTASNFMWLTPNNCDNMHDLCYNSTSVAEGNLYLSKLIPSILNTTIFRTQQAALFVTWDEGNLENTLTTQEVAALWAGSDVKTQYCNCTTTQYYSHASFPKTMEIVWNLQSLNQQDTTAPAMIEFFT
jgi:phosphatidylinositol-3-phosphatase